MAAVVEVNGLSKTFVRGFWRRRTQALHDVSLAVEAGEVFGFLGPNGAGKTTTIKVLMGLVFPSGGDARLFGRPVGERAVKARVGYLSENPYYYDHLSVLELLDLVGRLYGLDAAARRRRGAELIDRLGLGHAATRPLRAYSKGMLQRAGLAQALVGDPDLVVLDEPMSGLDPIGRKEVRDLIVELRARGKTVFFSTHILSDATLLCDRVALVVQGRLRGIGPLGALVDPRVHSVDVLWEGGDRERLQAEVGEWRSSSEGELKVVADHDEASRIVARIVACGGRILAVTTHRQTLEELFVSESRRAASAGGPT